MYKGFRPVESTAERRERTRKILTKLRSKYPDARLELDFSNPLELLIALILAAQARDELVNRVTAKAFQRYRTAADWAGETAEKLHEQLRQVNFYRRKTEAIQKTCQALMDRFEGQVPDNLEDLVSLPGVGRKTANIVLGNAFRKQTIGVDTHVGRLSQRLGLTAKKKPDDIEADLLEVVPPRSRVRFCHVLQFHGRSICLAKQPACQECTIRKLCPYPD
jgi:endonuclease-3